MSYPQKHRMTMMVAAALACVFGPTASAQQGPAGRGSARSMKSRFSSRKQLLLWVAAIVAPGGANAQPSAARMPQSGSPQVQGPAEQAKPWRATEALGLSWLRFGLEHRSRFEHLKNDFRVSNPGNATGYLMRTLLSAELRFSPVVIGAELQDSRAYTPDGTPLNTTVVNPLELLQGYAGLRGEGWFASGDATSLTLGRMTMDVGSRRLVARNEFRNTINAFTGLDLQWTSPRRDLVRTFAVMPVIRLPSDVDALKENQVEFDRENTAAVFWGTFFQSRPVGAKIFVETYVFGLHERDSKIAPSANRQLYTPGFRILRAPAAGGVDFQLEGIGQFGKSRASTTPTDTTNLEQLAFSGHASCGYRFDVAWAPRLVLQYDYASGDRSPKDQKNQRFDLLFGARRFELGPTGLYGAIARSNVSTPGVRFELAPHRKVDVFAAYRVVWLASARDAWTTAGLRDPTGDSGSFVGQQVEARVRWHVLPKNLSFDVGGALFVRGEFAKKAPDAEREPAAYVYSQLTGTI